MKTVCTIKGYLWIPWDYSLQGSDFFSSISEEEFILEIPNATSTRPVLQTIDDGKQTPKTCLSRCRQMIINGYLCGGFNFHIENLSCQLFSGSLIPSGKQSIGISKSSMRNLFRIDLFRGMYCHTYLVSHEDALYNILFKATY